MARRLPRCSLEVIVAPSFAPTRWRFCNAKNIRIPHGGAGRARAAVESSDFWRIADASDRSN